MGLAVGEGEAEEESGGVEDVGEGLDDGDAAAFADEGDLAAEGLRQGTLGGLAEGGVGVHEVGLAGVAEVDVEADDGGELGAEVGFGGGEDFGGVLIGDEAEGEFDEGLFADDGLGAFALIAAADAVDFCGGASPAAFALGVAGFAEEGGGAGEGEGFGVAVAEGLPGGALPILQGADVVVEAGDEDAAFGVVQGGGEAGGHGAGVCYGATEDAGVEVDGGATDFGLQAGDAPEAVGEGADAGGDHAGV